MNLIRLFIIFLTLIAVIEFSSFANAVLAGQPFEVLQEQIDTLKQQLEALQTGPVKAYVTKKGTAFPTNLSPETDYHVMTLNLPEGMFIYTITITASYYPYGLYDYTSQTFLDCSFLYDMEQPLLGHHIGGGINGTDTLAITMEDEILPMQGNETEITLSCIHTPFDTDATMTINSAIWTAIKVGELEIQNIE